MKPVNALITGSNGQLGLCMQSVCKEDERLKLHLTTLNDLDITSNEQIEAAIFAYQPDYILNFAAYTAVDKAEEDKDLAHIVNEKGPELLAKVASKKNIKLIHISTDYVFSGNTSSPYVETDKVSPINTYGKSKLLGEKAALKEAPGSLVIRTSWLYSEYEANFFKSMLRLSTEREELKIVSDQIGSPTYAVSLAEAVKEIVLRESSVGNKKKFQGVYHFSNEGVCSWYDFARAIVNRANSKCIVKPIYTKDYPTLAERPKVSLLNKSKIKKALSSDNKEWEIKHWEDELERCFLRLNNKEQVAKKTKQLMS